jgi:hypothetical protein
MIFKWSVLDVEGKTIFFTEKSGEHWVEHRVASNNILAAVIAKFPKLDKLQQRKLFIALKTRATCDKLIMKLITIAGICNSSNFEEIPETLSFMMGISEKLDELRVYITKDIEI